MIDRYEKGSGSDRSGLYRSQPLADSLQNRRISGRLLTGEHMRISSLGQFSIRLRYLIFFLFFFFFQLSTDFSTDHVVYLNTSCRLYGAVDTKLCIRFRSYSLLKSERQLPEVFKHFFFFDPIVA